MPLYRVTLTIVDMNMTDAHSLLFTALNEQNVDYKTFEIHQED